MAEISSDIMRGFNDIIVLSVLADGDSYGYEIAKRIEIISEGQYPIKETTLYATFTRLEKGGLICSYQGSETYGRQRTYYRLTDGGKNYLIAKCGEWSTVKSVIDKFTEKFMTDN